MPRAPSQLDDPSLVACIRKREQRVRSTITRGCLPIYFHDEYACGAHGFDTTRKAAWVAASLASDPITGVTIVEPTPLALPELEIAHDRTYIDAIRTGTPAALAAAQGFRWDPGLWRMVTRSNGGAVDAALAALAGGVAGSLSSGLHHARCGTGRGFCTFNGLAIAAHAALIAGARRVLVLDFDAHCGGGTASILTHEDRVTQVDVATDAFDRYASTERAVLTVVNTASEYLPAIERALAIAALQEPYDLCIYNAGMDPYEHCRIGGLLGITSAMLRTREEMVFAWCTENSLPIAFVLAGGYINGATFPREDLIALHRHTINAAVRCIR